MVKTIGNPLSWTVQRLAGSAQHAAAAVESLGGSDAAAPGHAIEIRELTTEDIRHALDKGIEDFRASRADVMFLVIIYPVAGLVLAGFGLQLDLLPLLFPLAAGFALLGPLAAVGLYEMSRLREAGKPSSWLSALGIISAPNFAAIVVLGLYLMGIFLAWMLVANWVYQITLGPEPPSSIAAFASDVLTTGAGWTMIVLGIGIGFLFALLVLAISLVSFPLLLDRNVGVPTAIVTSVRVFLASPAIAMRWGLIVAVALVLGSVPLFLGLIVAMPVLGHATWHLYRRAVV